MPRLSASAGQFDVLASEARRMLQLPRDGVPVPRVDHGKLPCVGLSHPGEKHHMKHYMNHAMPPFGNMHYTG